MDPRTQVRGYADKSYSVISTNAVLRNTFILLAMTLVFSAVTAGIAMVTNAPPLNFLITLVGYVGLLFLVRATANSAFGLVSVFALTGFMGYTLGPMLNFYVHFLSNGTEIIMTAMGGTGLIFFGLAGYAMTTRKNFNYLGGFLTVGLLVALGAMVLNLFMGLPALSMAISGAVILLMAGFILFDISRIIQGGETNYINATVSLYISIFNLFVHLLNLLAMFSGRQN